jgi:hypothetical protein
MSEISSQTKRAQPELCSKCGVPVYRRSHPALRMCARHAKEHLASLPPFACGPDDIDGGEGARCSECGHLWQDHGRGGCRQLTARLVLSYGEVVEDTGSFVCGCRL